MIASDVIAVLQWWGVLFLLGIGFLPLTIRLFDKFFDKGYIFSKILGLSITTYAIFVLGTLHIVPFSILGGYIIFIVLAGLIFILSKDKWRIRYVLQKFWPIIVFEEIFFLAALFAWAYIHSFSPDIHGLEKYMDYGFINSTLRGTYFPPEDMWFPPLSINYYYFGHIMTAVLSRLSTVPSNIGFNLMLSTIFALCLTQTFSIGAALYTFLKREERLTKLKQFLAGFLTAALVTLAGNLHVLYAFFTPYKNDNPVPIWNLRFSPGTFPNNYWYPNATRYIHNTIHEFPIYSWVVADLHGHVLDIPLVLFIVALLGSMFMMHDPDEKPDETEIKTKPSVFMRSFIVHPFFLILIGLFLSMMYMTNAWDGAIYLLLTVLVLLFLYWQRIPNYKNTGEHMDDLVVLKDTSSSKKATATGQTQWQLPLIRDLLLSIGTVTASFSLFTTPYNIFFKPFVSGVGVLCAPDFLTKIGKFGPLLFEPNHCQHSYFWELLMLYGFFYFFVILFVIFVTKTKKLFHADFFILLLIILGTALIMIPEFIYVKDIYPAHYRANTMFKLVFQSFMLLSISCGYIIFRLMRPAVRVHGWIRPFSTVLFPLMTISLVSLVMTYPYLAVGSYYGNLQAYKSLDGTKYLQGIYPDDYDAIQWLNKNIKGQPIVLEAQGDSYTDFGRVSANTGLPTFLGWTVHEWLWRGKYEIPAARINVVKDMYELPDINQTKALLKQNNIEYVFIGAMEYQKYPNMNEAKFHALGNVVYEKNRTKIYKITL
jgi:YYY domain-containing protein